MKLIVALIPPTKLHAVREALEKIEVMRMTICDGQGFGPPPDRAGTHPPRADDGTLFREIALEIVVNDDFLDRTVKTLLEVARTGYEGAPADGRILILPAEEAIQVDDAARGPGAV